MSRKIRLEEDVYERIKSKKREDESFSDAVARLIGSRSFRDLRDVFTDDQLSEIRETQEAADSNDLEEVRDVSEYF